MSQIIRYNTLPAALFAILLLISNSLLLAGPYAFYSIAFIMKHIHHLGAVSHMLMLVFLTIYIATMEFIPLIISILVARSLKRYIRN